MKKILFKLKSALIACILVFAFTSCDKDDTEALEGLWAFRDINVIYYFNGQQYNVKESGGDLTELSQGFRGLSFRFTGKHVTVGMSGQTSQPMAYSLSGNIISINDGSTYIIWRYKVSGNTLELIWTREMMEMLGGSMPAELYDFDDIEFIMSFNKIK